jgi:glycosyltransferase 2 family protein
MPNTRFSKSFSVASLHAPVISGARRVVQDYFGFILRNVIGWVFILASLPVGLSIPIPGGLPVMFLIGFTLITFPGKRRLLSRVMRGTQMSVQPWPFAIVVIVISVTVTIAALWVLAARYEKLLLHLHLQWFHVLGVCLFAAGVSWCVLRAGLAVLNLTLRRIPQLRSFLRPWLRRRGINLLPPRRHRNMQAASPPPAAGLRPREDPIIELNEGYRRRAHFVWANARPWIKRLAGLAITIWIFVRILRPVVKNWGDPEVQKKLSEIEPWRFLIAVLMFSVFLFVFRSLAWRRIVKAFGFTLPIPAAVRIWSTSELARYVPGAIFQVVGRVVLAKPYGIRGSITSVTQILELAIFLLANVLIAVSCLWYFGWKNMHGQARTWLEVSFIMIPVLSLLLHPKICYGIINRLMLRLGKPTMEQRLSGQALTGVLVWNVLGLLWQAAAIYLLTEEALGLKIDWLWVLAGSYSLAWCAGFLAFWAPGGIGVRELVFVTAMGVALPEPVRHSFSTSPAALVVFLSFLSILLRLWATAGELVLASIAYTLDYRGALGRPDAPGRSPPSNHSSSSDDDHLRHSRVESNPSSVASARPL